MIEADNLQARLDGVLQSPPPRLEQALNVIRGAIVTVRELEAKLADTERRLAGREYGPLVLTLRTYPPESVERLQRRNVALGKRIEELRELFCLTEAAHHLSDIPMSPEDRQAEFVRLRDACAAEHGWKLKFDEPDQVDPRDEAPPPAEFWAVLDQNGDVAENAFERALISHYAVDATEWLEATDPKGGPYRIAHLVEARDPA